MRSKCVRPPAFTTVIFLFTLIATSASATTYTWVYQDGTHSWSDPNSWSPARTTPAASDELRFDSNRPAGNPATVTVTNVPAQTIAAFRVGGRTIVNLVPVADANTLTITGSANARDFFIGVDSAINVNSTASFRIHLAAGTIGEIIGSMTFGLGSHSLTTAGDAVVTFTDGSRFTAGASHTGNVFGNTTANSIVFASGSTFVMASDSGTNPFGMTAPSSVLKFESGSLYSQQSNTSPSLSGRTLSDYELNKAGANVTLTGSSALVMDDLTVVLGALNFNMTGNPGHSIKGNISVASGAALTFSPSSPGTVSLNGSSAQTISGPGTIGFGPNSTIRVANGSGVTLAEPLVMTAGTLHLDTGILTTGNNSLHLQGATLTRVNGYVFGNLTKRYSALGSKTFEVGTANGYSRVIANVTNGTLPLDLTVSATQGPHPGMNAGTSIQRYWMVSATGGPTADLTFHYLLADVRGNESIYKVYRVSGGVPTEFPASVVTPATHSATISGVSSFSDWTVGEGDVTPPAVTSVSVPANDTYISGENLDFTVNFSENVTVSGTPRIAIVENSGTVYAEYISGSGTSALLFRNTVGNGNSDPDGIAVASSIDLNGGTIRDAALNNAATTLNSAGSTAGVRVDGVAPTVSGIVRAGSTPTNATSLGFTVTFSEGVTNVTTSAFELATTGTAAGTISNVSPVNASTYTVTVSPASGAGTMRLDVKSSGTGITDLPGNPLPGGFTTGEAYTLDPSAPAVTSVDVPAGNTYAPGQDLDFNVHFSESVTVSGTPRIAIAEDSGTVYAGYVSGSGTDALLFRNTVAGGDSDSDGIAVASSIDLNGGTIQDTTLNDAAPALNNVGSTAAVLVDGVAPAVFGVVRAGATPTNATSLDFTVTFDEGVTGVTTSAFELATTGTAAGTISNVAPVSASAYTVTVSPATGEGTLRLDVRSSGTGITDIPGNPLQAGFTTGEAYTLDPSAPAVASVDVPASATFTVGQSLDFIVHFNESVTVGGTPRIAIVENSGTVYASYVSGSGTGALVFRNTVAAGNSDPDGIAVASSIDLNGGTIRDATLNAAAPALNNVGSTVAVRVDGVAPTVFGIARTGTTPTKATSLGFTVTFSESVTGVTTFAFALATTGTAAGTIANVSPVSASTYTVTVSPATGAGTLRLDVKSSGSGITDLPGNPLQGGFTTGELYTLDPVAPAVTSVHVPASATYGAGQNLDFTVNFSESVTVSGTPRIAIVENTGTVHATYQSGSGTSALLFRNTVVAGNSDPNGIALASAIDLNGGTIRDAVLNDAAPALNNAASTFAVRVDGVAPTVSGIVRTGMTPTNAASLDFTVTFSEGVTNVTASAFALETTGTAAGTISSVAAVNAITYTVTVTSVTGEETLRLDVRSSGTGITDLPGNPLQGGFTTGQDYTLDPIAPLVTFVDVPASATYTSGQTLDFTVHFTEAVTVSGMPRIEIVENSGTVYASYVSGSGTDALLFRNTVIASNGNSDPDGIVVGSSIDLNGGTIRDIATNDAYLTLHSTGSTTGVLVNASLNPPTVVSVTSVHPTLTNLPSVDYTVTFSEIVTGVDATDFSFELVGVTGASVSSVTPVTGATYTVSVNTGRGDGKLRLIVDANGSIRNWIDIPLKAQFQGGPGYGNGTAYTIDKTPPAVKSISSSLVNETVRFEVIFSEPVRNLDKDDFTVSGVSGASVIGIEERSRSYYVTVSTGTGDGTMRLGVVGATASINDLAGNTLTADFTSAPFTFNNPPKVESIRRAGDTNPFCSRADFTVTFTEAVRGVEAANFKVIPGGDVTGASIAGVSPPSYSTSTVYTVTVHTGSGIGTIGLDLVYTGAITDAGGRYLNGPFTGEVSTVENAPSAPRQLVATSGLDKHVALTWTAPYGAPAYNVYRRTASSTSYSLLASGVTATSYDDRTAENDKQYFYIVSATNPRRNCPTDSGNLPSNEVSAKPSAPPPPPSMVSIAVGDGKVVLSWQFIQGAKYRVKRSDSAGGPYAVIAEPSTPFFEDRSVTNGTPSFYVVTTVMSGENESKPSSEVSGTPNLPAELGVVISQVYGDGGSSYSSRVKNDFVELFNRSNQTVVLDRWALVYSYGTRDRWSLATSLFGTIAPGQYYLVKGAAGGYSGGYSGGYDLSYEDMSGDFDLHSTDGGVALLGSFLTFSGSGCPPPSPNIADLVGYGSVACHEGKGPTGKPSSGAAVRNSAGCTDTNDNSADFTVAEAYPRNRFANKIVCTGVNYPPPPPPELTPPRVVSVKGVQPTITNLPSVDYTVTFSESVTGVDATDFSFVLVGVTGAGVSSVTPVTGDTYTVSVNTGTGDGKLQLIVDANDSIRNAASIPLKTEFTGGPGYTSGTLYTIDKTAPAVRSIMLQPTTNDVLQFRVTFSEPVRNVDQDDFTVTQSGVSDAAVTSITGTGEDYNCCTVIVSSGKGEGTIRLDVAAAKASINDPAGNALTTDFTGAPIAINNAPRVESIQIAADTPCQGRVDFTVTFTEAVRGVDVHDFGYITGGGVTGASIAGVTHSSSTYDKVYTVTVNTGTGIGTIGLNLYNNSTITDNRSKKLAGNTFAGDVYTAENKPRDPMLYTATGGLDKRVRLRWTEQPGAPAYYVRRSTVSNQGYSTIAQNVAATTYDDDTALNGVQYFYKVGAINPRGKCPSNSGSLESNELSATPSAPLPPPSVSIAVDNGKVRLSWQPVKAPTSYNVSYNVKRGPTGGPYHLIGNTSGPRFYDYVTSGTPYSYVVTSVISGENEGEASSEVSGTPNWPSALGVVISQVYGGGGGSGATLKNDFVELFNRGTQTVLLDNWYVYYTPADSGTWSTRTYLSGEIKPGQYYLVKGAPGAGGTVKPPKADKEDDSIDLHATNGKVALGEYVSNLSGCPIPSLSIADFVGYGGANCSEGKDPAGKTPTKMSNTLAAVRNGDGCTDTNVNAADFTVKAPAPRNTKTTHVCQVFNTPAAIAAPSDPIAWASQNAAPLDVHLSGNDDDDIYTWSATPGAGVESVSITAGQGTGAITYTVLPVTGFRGTATFTASLSDGVNPADTQPVHIEVAGGGGNHAPRLTRPDDPIASVAPDTPFAVTLSGIDDDGIYNWTATPGPGVANVNVSGGQGTSRVTCTVELSAGYSGTATFTLSLSDNVNPPLTQAVNISVVPAEEP